MKILKILVFVMVGALLILFMKPSFTYLFSGWRGFEVILTKIAIVSAVALAFGYYGVLLWEKHKP